MDGVMNLGRADTIAETTDSGMRVISLVRTPERLRRFQDTNMHLAPEVVRATDGREVSYVDFLPPSWSPGAIGCMLSHLRVWNEVTALNRPLTVFEDDAVIHHQFVDLANAVLASLPEDWHFCLWGFNFDAAVMFDVLPGVSPCVALFDQPTLRASGAAFQDSFLRAQAFRLARAFGTIAYTISPAGVAALRPLCVPPRMDPLPYYDGLRPNTGLDTTLNAAYQKVNAFVCFPPVVATMNEHEGSTVL